jgi:hypothetical protein
MNFNKPEKVFTSKFVGTGPSSYKKRNLLGRGLITVENQCSIVLTTGLDSRLIDGGKGVSPTRRPLFTPRKIPGTHFF